MNRNINFVTNLVPNLNRGGWDGINHNILLQLHERSNEITVSTINPQVRREITFLFKLRKLLPICRPFILFSERRLTEISRQVEQVTSKDDIVIFFGATPWALTEQNRYSTYLDIHFLKYLEIYHSTEQFCRRDISRIVKAEKEFLEKATNIFWGSSWALRSAEKDLDLQLKHKSTIINTGGNIPIPIQTSYNPKEPYLLFVSHYFKEKGGPQVFECLQRIDKKIKLYIVGEKPPQQILKDPRVNYLGVIKKDTNTGIESLKKLYSNALCLIHPTKMDTMGAVIVEAGYHGCPTIAPDKFGIPDFIKHKQNGFLLDENWSIGELAQAIGFVSEAFSNIDARRRISSDYKKEFSWSTVVDKIIEKINQV